MPSFSADLDVYNDETQDLLQELLIDAQAEIISHRYDKAIEFLEQAAEKGSSKAAASLGAIYVNGEPGKVTRDYLRGFQWYLRALTLSANATPVDCSSDLLAMVQKFTDIFKFHWIDLDRNPVEWKEGYEMLRSLAKKLEQESNPVKLNSDSDDALQIEENYRRAIRITLFFSRGFINYDVSRNDKAASSYRKCISVPPSTLEEALSLQHAAVSKLEQIANTDTTRITDASSIGSSSIGSSSTPTTPATDRPASPTVCANCKKGKEMMPVCSRCKVVKYCNSQCQKEHDKVHKLICMPKTNSN